MSCEHFTPNSKAQSAGCSCGAFWAPELGWHGVSAPSEGKINSVSLRNQLIELMVTDQSHSDTVDAILAAVGASLPKLHEGKYPQYNVNIVDWSDGYNAAISDMLDVVGK